MFRVFVRNWWKEAPRVLNMPNNLLPDPTARKTILCTVDTEKEAREIAKRYNSTHKPGRLSRKAEFEEIR